MGLIFSSSSSSSSDSQPQHQTLSNGTKPSSPCTATATTTTTTSTYPSSVMPLVGRGRYEVGCADLMTTTSSSNDDSSAPPGSGIFARMFYPSRLKGEDHPDKVEYPIWRPRREYLDGLAVYRNISPSYIHLFFDWIMGEKRIPAGWHLPLYTPTATDAPTFPVVVFSHGISGNRLCYSILCSSLASYGYVVAALEHRDNSSCWTYYFDAQEDAPPLLHPIPMAKYPEGEEEFEERRQQIDKRVEECLEAWNVLSQLNQGSLSPTAAVHGADFDWSQFRNRLNFNKAAVMGHSMGGSTAFAAGTHSSHFKSTVSLDSWLYPLDSCLYPLIKQLPSLSINAAKWQWQANINRMLELNDTNPHKLLITFKDIVHQSFSDFTYLMPGMVGRKMGVQGQMDPLHTGDAILEIIVAYLEGGGEGPTMEQMREVTGRYKEFVFEGHKEEGEEDLVQEN